FPVYPDDLAPDELFDLSLRGHDHCPPLSPPAGPQAGQPVSAVRDRTLTLCHISQTLGNQPPPARSYARVITWQVVPSATPPVRPAMERAHGATRRRRTRSVHDAVVIGATSGRNAARSGRLGPPWTTQFPQGSSSSPVSRSR